jgi:hypothetical protein
MAIEIGSLVVELSANVARLSADMNKATGIVSGSMKNMSDSIQGISNRMNLIVGSQVFQSLDLLARRGMEAFSAIKHSAIDAADELNKLSQKTGFSTESLSGLKYAAELSDLSLEGMTKSLKSLSVNMVEAKGGSKEMAGIFKQLGVSMDDPEAALLQLAEQFQQMPDGAQKAALAVKLFGKEGLTMIPFLNQGRDGIAELTAEAQRFGLVIDSETARQAEAFNDNLTRLKANVGGLVQQLGMSMLPMLMSLSESLLSAKTAVGGFDDNVRQIVGRRAGVEGFVESFARGMAHLYNMIMPVIVIGRQLYDVLKGIAIEGAGWAAQIGALASGNISGFRAIREAVSRDAEQLRKDSDAFIARISSSAQGAAGNVTKFFDEHRRTVRSGSQKYLMASEQDARLLQTAIDKAYKGAGRSVKDFDSVLSASSNNSKKVADEAAQRLASIKNADLDLDFAKVAAETEAIYALASAGEAATARHRCLCRLAQRSRLRRCRPADQVQWHGRRQCPGHDRNGTIHRGQPGRRDRRPAAAQRRNRPHCRAAGPAHANPAGRHHCQQRTALCRYRADRAECRLPGGIGRANQTAARKERVVGPRGRPPTDCR